MLSAYRLDYKIKDIYKNNLIMALSLIAKKNKTAPSLKVKNWYVDRYMSLAVQRNFLFIFAAISSFVILIAMVVIKNLYEQKSISPYLIEVDKQSNIITMVDSITKEVYTAQEAIKEYFFLKYIQAREGYKESNSEEYNEILRTYSSPYIYEDYKQSSKKVSYDAQRFARDAVVEVKIRSITYMSPERVEIRFAREFYSLESGKKSTYNFTLNMSFKFINLESNLLERRINPLGFQVTRYLLLEEREFDKDGKIKQ